MIVRASETQTLKIQRRTVQRLSFSIRLKQAQAGNHPFPNLKAITLKCQLVRNGHTYTLFSENASVLLRLSMFKAGFDSLNASQYMLHMSNLPAGSHSSWLVPGMIDLGSPINLQGDDELLLEVSANSDWYGDHATSTDSFIDFEWRDKIGVETAIPLIRTSTIQATNEKVDVSLGDNVTQIAFLNTETFPNGGVTDITAIWRNITITSDRYNISDNLDRMMGRRASQFDHHFVAAARGHCFLYEPETEIDRCQVQVNLMGANVITSQNVIAWRTYYLDAYTLQRGITMQQKHAIRDHEKVSTIR